MSACIELEDMDITLLRERAQASLAASRERRALDAAIRDGWVDRALMYALVAIIVVMVLSVAARPAIASPRARPGRALSMALHRACPQYRAMTRARCIQWVQVAQCEAGGGQRRVSLRSLRQINWRSHGKYHGGLQFSASTWRSNVGRIPSRHMTTAQRRERASGRYARAYRAPVSVQILAAEVLRVRIGGEPQQSAGWPVCGARF